MSSKPSPSGVADLLKAARDMRDSEQRIDDIRLQIEKLTTMLSEQQDIRAKAADAVTKQLHAMDCATSGNFGWEGRIRYMLAELVDQAERHARNNP